MCRKLAKQALKLIRKMIFENLFRTWHPNTRQNFVGPPQLKKNQRKVPRGKGKSPSQLRFAHRQTEMASFLPLLVTGCLLGNRRWLRPLCMQTRAVRRVPRIRSGGDVGCGLRSDGVFRVVQLAAVRKSCQSCYRVAPLSPSDQRPISIPRSWLRRLWLTKAHALAKHSRPSAPRHSAHRNRRRAAFPS